MTTDMNRHFTMGALVRYALPSICMVIFMSIYGVVDGLFVSNFAGTTAFAAVNLIMPFIMILATCGSMIGTGGSALVGKTRGEGDDARANALFSEFVIAAAAIGTALAIVGAVFMPTVAQALGASGDMLDLAVAYGRICMISLPCFILQYAFQILFVTAGKPQLGEQACGPGASCAHELNVSQSRRPRQEQVVFEHHRKTVGHVLHPAGVRRLEPRKQAQGRRLPAPGGAHKRGDALAGHFEGKTAKDGRSTVAFIDAIELHRNPPPPQPRPHATTASVS